MTTRLVRYSTTSRDRSALKTGGMLTVALRRSSAWAKRSRRREMACPRPAVAASNVS